jgi:D-lactate dehydrogenase (cytochrome)
MPNIIQPSEPFQEPVNTPPVKIINSKIEIEEKYTSYLTDESRYPGGHADEIIFIYSEKQIIETLKRAYSKKIPVTISAGRTGIVGGAVPFGGILLVIEHMNKFKGVRWNSEKECWCIRVEPGLSLEALNEILRMRNFNDIYPNLSEENQKSIEQFYNETDQWFYPVDPTEKTAYIGGTVATNASGSRSLKYGPTRNYVLSLRVVLADGTLLSINRGEVFLSSDTHIVIETLNGQVRIPFPKYSIPKVKNVAGYYIQKQMDFIDFFIGSEGTLGVITEIELALKKKPEFVLCGLSFFNSEEKAINFVKKTRTKQQQKDSHICPTALEYFDNNSLNILRKKREKDGVNSKIPPFPEKSKAAVYFEQDGKEDDLEVFCSKYDSILSASGTSMNDTWGGIDEREMIRMTEFRHALPETINSTIGQRKQKYPSLHKVGTDFVVPDNALERIIKIYRSTIEKERLEYAIFGHIGENHLHVNILPKDDEELIKAKELYLQLARQAVNLKGTVSGEHGIGKIKRFLLHIMYSSEDISEMKKIKDALDPKALLGKGNLF